MSRKLALLMICLTVLIGILVPATVSAEILVGVKVGDWVKHTVVFYAETPPPSPYPIWREIEVLGVEGTTVTYDLTWEWSNGTQGTDTFTENLDTGVSDALIIPANLNNGDMFSHEDFGGITISGVEERTYAGARRTVVFAEPLAEAMFYWDKTTGVLVEWLFYSEYWGAFMSVEMIETNMWQAEFFLPINPTLFYVLIIVAVVIVVAMVLSNKGKRKKRVRKRTK